MSQDPPPDLVIEIDITSGSLDKFPIYRQIGVPEIWRYSRHRLAIFHFLNDDYQASETSPAFHGVKAADLARLLHESLSQPSTQWLKSLQDWADAQKSNRI